MASTKAAEIIKEFVTPILDTPKGLSAQDVIQHYKNNTKVDDISIYNNIRLKAKMMGLIKSN